MTDKRPVEVSHTGERAAFGIEAGPKAFFLLSNGLYSRKIEAVVREISTNASDAHVEAGCPDRPFDVHFPVTLNKNFIVRDYGPGLSHEAAMHTYTTFFLSTKNDNNDTNGCLGLGCKSPFAYKDMFTVVSYFEGMKRTYTAFQDTNGPQFILVDETESYEESGLEVIVPVDSWDYRSFEEAAYTIYKNFDLKPNFINYQPDFSNYTPTISGDNWGIYEDEENCVVMGQVAYPIDSSQLSSFDGVREFLDSINGLRLEVPIGSIDFNPSRENLSYVDETKIVLSDAIIGIIDDVGKEIEKKISNEPTLFKARKAYLAMDNFMMSHCNSILWNGEKLFDNVAAEMIEVDKDEPILYFTKDYYKKQPYKQSDPEIFFKNPIFIHKDIDVAHMPRVKELINCHQRQYKSCNIYIYTGKDISKFQKILGGAEKSDIISLSSLPKPAYNSNTGGGIPCMMYDEDQGTFVESKMSVKYENAIYLVETRRNFYLKDSDWGRHYGLRAMSSLLNKLIDMGCELNGTIYTVKPGMVTGKDLKNRKNWKSLKEALVPGLQDIVNSRAEEYQLIQNAEYLSYGVDKAFARFGSDKEIAALVDEYTQYQLELSKAQKSVAGLNDVERLIELYGVKPDSSTIAPYVKRNFNSRFSKLLERYPMLKESVLSNFVPDKDLPIITQYIKDIQELNEFRKVNS